MIGQGEGFAYAHAWRVVGPGGAVGNGEGGAGDGVADVGAVGIFGPEVGQDGADGGLRGEAAAGDEEALAQGVIPLHAEAGAGLAGADPVHLESLAGDGDGIEAEGVDGFAYPIGGGADVEGEGLPGTGAGVADGEETVAAEAAVLVAPHELGADVGRGFEAYLDGGHAAAGEGGQGIGEEKRVAVTGGGAAVGAAGDGEGADVAVDRPVTEGVGVVELGIGERGDGGGERGVFGAVVRTTVNPVVAFAVFEGKAGVGGGGAGGGGLGRVEIGVGGDFEIAGDESGGVEGQRQLGQRHRRVDDGTGGDGVMEGIGGVLTPDLVGGHGGPTVGGVGVLDQDAGKGSEGGAGGDVEIIAQGVGAAGEEKGVFLVGVVAGLGGVVLVVDDALSLSGGQVAGAGVGGEHDLGFVGAVGDDVAADFGGGIKVGEFTGGGGDFFEPPDGERVGVAGEGVDGDDGAGLGDGHADREGVLVGGGRIGGATSDVAGHAVITGGRDEALADVDGAGEGGGGVAFEVAVAAFGLGHEADVPDPAVVAGKFEQGAVELVAGEADEQALGKGVEHGLVLLLVILVDDGGNGAVFEFEAGAGGGGAAVGGDGVVGETGDVVGPDLQVFVQVFGPVEFEAGGEAGGGEDTGVEGFEPVEDDAVFEGVFAFGVVGEGTVGTHGAGVVRGGVVGVAAVDGQGDEIGLVEIGADFVAEGDTEGGGGGSLGDLDDVGPEEFVGAVVAEGTEVFDEQAAGDVVGVELADAVGFLEPNGA